jgi:phage recombination protein Bet
MPDDVHTTPEATDLVPIARPRLPWHPDFQKRFDVDAVGWRALIDAVWPAAKTSDAVVLALSYCKARRLDPFKRPVHIVPVWSRALGKEIESVWPGIGELRTTAFRTGLYAGRDRPDYGPDKTVDLGGVAMTFPEWCQITVYRLDRSGARMAYPGPQVYWLETYATAKRDTIAPNDQWRRRPRGQLEKCAEAAALRAAFPEEIGNDYTDDEMQGQIIEHAPVAPPRPELADYIETGEPKGRGRSRARPAESLPPAEAKNPPQTAAGAAARGEAEWFFADEVGEVYEFDEVNDAVTTYAQRLEAAKGNGKLLEATWENGARLLAALRERGHGDMADALNTAYGQLLGEIETATTAAAGAAGQPPAETQQAQSAAYDVAVPMPEGMPANQWHMSARAKLKEMTEAQRPPVDFRRFREVNAAGLDRLRKELRSWANMLDKVISEGAAAPS